MYGIDEQCDLQKTGSPYRFLSKKEGAFTRSLTQSTDGKLIAIVPANCYKVLPADGSLRQKLAGTSQRTWMELCFKRYAGDKRLQRLLLAGVFGNWSKDRVGAVKKLSICYSPKHEQRLYTFALRLLPHAEEAEEGGGHERRLKRWSVRIPSDFFCPGAKSFPDPALYISNFMRCFVTNIGV